MVRSQVATFSKILISSILWLVGCETWNLSEEYLDKEEGPVNAELARQVLPDARTATQVLFIGRIILFFLSFRWPRLIKLSIYYELFIEWIFACMPVNINAVRDIQLLLSNTTQTTIASYFSLVPTLIAVSLTIIPVHIRRVVLYGDPVSTMVISCITAIISQLSLTILIHLITTKIGMVYIDAEVLREGKDQTLDNLNVGVVILNKKDLKIRYFNKAASVSSKNISSTMHPDQSKPDYTSFVK